MASSRGHSALGHDPRTHMGLSTLFKWLITEGGGLGVGTSRVE